MNIDDTQLTSIDHFKYLRSKISSNGTLEKDIEAQISKANQLFGWLHFPCDQPQEHHADNQDQDV